MIKYFVSFSIILLIFHIGLILVFDSAKTIHPIAYYLGGGVFTISVSAILFTVKVCSLLHWNNNKLLIILATLLLAVSGPIGLCCIVGLIVKYLFFAKTLSTSLEDQGFLPEN